MDCGFVKAQSDNLPMVNTMMMVNFFSKNSQYVSSEIKNVKDSRSGRENYGDNAIGYVQVKRNGVICTVKAKVTPEHKLRLRPYDVILVCNESEDIVETCKCVDCPASQGGCKHAVAFLSWIHRRTEEPSTTDIKCYWRRSKMAEVGTKCMKYKEILKLPARQYATNGRILSTIVKEAQKRGTKDVMLLNNFNDTETIKSLGLHQLSKNFAISKIANTPEEFIIFCQNSMNPYLCAEVSNLTVEQANSSLWHELRYGRMTASKLHEAAHCSTFDGSLVESLLGAKIVDTEAILHGRRLEKTIFNELKKKDPRLTKSGFIISDKYPLFGASPDGICNDYVVEIKCPSTKAWKEKYFKDDVVNFKCYAQMQLQMLFANRQKALFCVASLDYEKSAEMIECFVPYEEKYCLKLMDRATEFWKKALFQKVVSFEVNN